MSTLTGRTVTKQLRIETRQHELMGVDLGEGPRRRDLLLGFIVVPVWIGLMWLILGPPTKVTSLLYMAPPMLFLVYGIQENSRNSRRMNVTMWALALRHGLVGHLPLIRGGARRAARNERLPVVERWPFGRMARSLGAHDLTRSDGSLDWSEVSKLAGLGWTRRYAARDRGRMAGPPIVTDPQVWLYDTESLVDVAETVAAKQSRRGRKASK